VTLGAPDVGAGATRVRPPHRGTTLVEVLIVLTAMIVVGAMAAPTLGGRRDDLATAGAARHLATQLQHGRMDAIRRATHVAYRFQVVGAGIRYALFADGNGNGVRTVDIGHGVDAQVSAWESLSDHFAGVTFSIAPGVMDIDSGSPIAGDPVRVGGSGLLSFSPTGTATSGTLYLSGRTGQQYAVRVLGATGRIRILRFVRGENQWTSP
jgi:type II secretory pathway pseudopilin PulG